MLYVLIVKAWEIRGEGTWFFFEWSMCYGATIYVYSPYGLSHKKYNGLTSLEDNKGLRMARKEWEEIGSIMMEYLKDLFHLANSYNFEATMNAVDTQITLEMN